MDDIDRSNWSELAMLDVWLNRLIIVDKPTEAHKIRNDVVLDLKNHIKGRILELSK